MQGLNSLLEGAEHVNSSGFRLLEAKAPAFQQCICKCSRPGWTALGATYSSRRCPCPRQGVGTG